MPKDNFQNEVDVLKFQRDKLISLDKGYSDINNDLDELEKRIQLFMKSNNVNSSNVNNVVKSKDIDMVYTDIKETQANKKFDDLLEEANKKGYIDVDINEVASIEEIKEVNELLNSYYKSFTKQYDLDKYDYAIAGIVGTIAALIDLFLVTNINGKDVTTGKLKSGVEGLWNQILSQEKIKSLEELNKVTYDVSSNTSKISQEVLGLCPLYHRFQSLGHDPILGFVFGVSDLMRGNLTAIDSNGRLIIQSVSRAQTKSFIEAIITVFGHFLSDVGTKSKTGKILSVPAPLTPLLQLIQVGSIEYKGQKLTVGDLAKKMYYDGYNFNHFIGMSVPVFLIEVLIRLYFVIKEMFYKSSEISIKNNPKLDVMLCISNGILSAENTGKIAITKNPFSINYVSWISTAKYGLKTLKWIIYDRELAKVEYAQKNIDTNWEYLLESVERIDINTNIYYIE
ncbi:hypothetical protein EAI30_08935 [Romboutsia ilealis]|nr:hypothetical protein [Romboutsia ilealis]